MGVLGDIFERVKNPTMYDNFLDYHCGLQRFAIDLVINDIESTLEKDGEDAVKEKFSYYGYQLDKALDCMDKYEDLMCFIDNIINSTASSISDSHKNDIIDLIDAYLSDKKTSFTFFDAIYGSEDDKQSAWSALVNSIFDNENVKNILAMDGVKIKPFTVDTAGSIINEWIHDPNLNAGVTDPDSNDSNSAYTPNFSMPAPTPESTDQQPESPEEQEEDNK